MKPGNATMDRAPPGKLPSGLDGPNKGELISRPINGTPIPAGYKFGAKDPPPHADNGERERKAKSGRFWGFGRTYSNGSTATNHITPRAVFGVSLENSLEVAQIADLPAIVFRCIEYLEAKNASLEEGIYRLNGSPNVVKNLKERFNTEGDVDLLRSDEHWDVHAIAGLLKTFLRDLPTNLLTRDLHLRFLGAIDLANPQERIDEMAALISRLPLPNHSLLRALTAHLVLIVQNASVNKMTRRNVGIIFSPTLGIPAGVVSLLVGEFEQVFNVAGGTFEPSEKPDGKGIESPPTEKTSNRNRRSYAGDNADKLLGLGGRKLRTTEEESGGNGDLFLPDSSAGRETENEFGPQALSVSMSHGKIGGTLSKGHNTYDTGDLQDTAVDSALAGLTQSTTNTQHDTVTSVSLSIPLNSDISGSISLEAITLIGFGGFGDVFSGVHTSHGKVALKRPRRVLDEALIRRFLREVDLWCSVSHPHILSCLGMCKIGGEVYVVSPFIENGDLLSCMAKGMDLNRIKLLFEVAEALTHLHHRGIVHGDVKAQNILLADDGSALLCDFGQAKAFDTMATSTESKGAGSVRWMAPELFIGEGRSMASDVYALGITIAEVLSGRAPYNNMTETLAVMFHVVYTDGRPPKEPSSSPEGKPYATLWETAEKCWVKDVKARPYMAQVLGMLFPLTRERYHQ